MFGRVASDPTVSRLIDALAATPQAALAALAAINQARVAVRGRVWKLAGVDAPDHQIIAEHPWVIDLDATLITAHWREGTGDADLQAGLRVPSSRIVGGPRMRGHW